MFCKLTKNIGIIGLLAVAIGAVGAFGSDKNIDTDLTQEIAKTPTKISITPLIAETVASAPCFINIDHNIRRYIVLLAAGNTVDPHNLRLVCKNFKDILHAEIITANNSSYVELPPMQKNLVKACYGSLEHDEIYKTFLKARVSYLEFSNSEAKELPFLSLKNPFCGSFNVSECLEMDYHLIVTTDLKRFFTSGGVNNNKFVVLFTLRNLVAQRVDSTAQFFEPIMDKWEKHHIGVFFRYGNWDPDEGCSGVFYDSSEPFSGGLFDDWESCGKYKSGDFFSEMMRANLLQFRFISEP